MAEIKINDKQWAALSKEDQEKVTKLLQRVGSLQKGDQIVGDAAVPASSEGDSWDFPDFRKEICRSVCETAGRAAQAACAVYSGPAFVVCIAAAQVALDECKRRC